MKVTGIGKKGEKEIFWQASLEQEQSGPGANDIF